MRYSIFIIFTILLTSCSKDKFNQPNEIKTMEIQLNNPQEMQEFTSGSTIHINGFIQANFSMHGYSVRLTKNNAQNILFEEFKHVHGNNLEIQSQWTNSVAQTTEVNIEIRAVGNHEGTQDLVLNRTIICLGE